MIDTRLFLLTFSSFSLRLNVPKKVMECVNNIVHEICSSLTVSNVVLYAIIILVLTFAKKMEMSDLNCPSYGCDKSLCREGNGTHYQGVDPEDGDSPRTLGRKIIEASHVHRKTVYWRRSLLVSFFSLIILWLILFKRLPSGPEIMTGLFVVGGIWYFSFNFYNYHHLDHAQKKIVTLTKKLVGDENLI